MSAENGLVSGAFIFNKAYEYGWEPEHDEIKSRAFDWDEEIVVGGGAPQEPTPEADVPTEPVEQLIAYFDAVYKPSDTVYIANRTSEDGEKAWIDGYSENVGTLIDGLKQCNGDIGAVLGDPIDDGMCIVVNPTNGKGRKMSDLASFNNVILESDEQTIEEFMKAAEKLQIPMLAATFSGNKSVHAVARIDAKDNKEHAQRRRLYLEAFASLGITLDKAAMTASQVTRLPGIMRHGVEQKLLSVNPNAISFEKWKQLYEKSTDEPLLPPFEELDIDEEITLDPEIVEGILRYREVALFTSRAKRGKTWLVGQLAICIATGQPWLGHNVKQGRVLFIDPELKPKTLRKRLQLIARNMGVDEGIVNKNIKRWSLRGAITKDGNVADVTAIAHDLELAGAQFDLVIMDSCSAFLEPGCEENDNASIRRFITGHVARIAKATGGAVIMVHHEGKGATGDKAAEDRARGAGAWVDCPDVVMQMSSIFPPDGGDPDKWFESALMPGAKARRLECVAIRDNPEFEPINLIFKWPRFYKDNRGELADWVVQTSAQRGGKAAGAIQQIKAQDRARQCITALRRDSDQNDWLTISANDAAAVCSRYLHEQVTATAIKKYVETVGNGSLKINQTSPRRWHIVRLQEP